MDPETWEWLEARVGQLEVQVALVHHTRFLEQHRQHHRASKLEQQVSQLEEEVSQLKERARSNENRYHQVYKAAWAYMNQQLRKMQANIDQMHKVQTANTHAMAAFKAMMDGMALEGQRLRRAAAASAAGPPEQETSSSSGDPHVLAPEQTATT